MADKEARIAFCPLCGNRAPQTVVYSHTYRTTWYAEDGTPDEHGPPMEAILCICSTCLGPLLYDGIWREEYGEWPLLAYPQRGELDLAIPQNVRDVYGEAFRVKRSAPRAFALLIRRALEAVCDDKQIPSGTLANRLRLLAEAGAVPPTLADMTDVLRTLGNEAAHGPLKGITVPMTWAIDEFFQAVVEYVYVAPSRLAAFRNSLAKLRQ